MGNGLFTHHSEAAAHTEVATATYNRDITQVETVCVATLFTAASAGSARTSTEYEYKCLYFSFVFFGMRRKQHLSGLRVGRGRPRCVSHAIELTCDDEREGRATPPPFAEHARARLISRRPARQWCRTLRAFFRVETTVQEGGVHDL